MNTLLEGIFFSRQYMFKNVFTNYGGIFIPGRGRPYKHYFQDLQFPPFELSSGGHLQRLVYAADILELVRSSGSIFVSLFGSDNPPLSLLLFLNILYLH